MDGIMHSVMRTMGRVTTTMAERVAEHVRLFGVDPAVADKSLRGARGGGRGAATVCTSHRLRVYGFPLGPCVYYRVAEGLGWSILSQYEFI
jgi:hypothetical protein